MIKIIDDLKFHITKDGERILLEDLQLSHLKNIGRQIERKSLTGIHIRKSSTDGYDDVDYLYGKDVKDYLGYKNYKQELKRRK